MDLHELSELKDSKKTDKGVTNKIAIQHNIFVKQMDFDGANVTYCGHHHDYDHVTMVASGRVRVKFGAVPFAGLPEEEKEYEAVSMFVTRAFRTHEITALEPDTSVCCIHALRTKDGEIFEPDVPKDHFVEESVPSINISKSTERSPLPEGASVVRAFNAFKEPETLNQILARATKEDTLKPGSQDNLIN